jgi:hypothetical protein
MKVFLAFLPDFFFFGAIAVLHRIVWYGKAANRGTSGLDAAMRGVVNLLKGAINDRGCAIVPLRDMRVSRSQKFIAALEPRPTNSIRHSRSIVPSLHSFRHYLDFSRHRWRFRLFTVPISPLVFSLGSLACSPCIDSLTLSVHLENNHHVETLVRRRLDA